MAKLLFSIVMIFLVSTAKAIEPPILPPLDDFYDGVLAVEEPILIPPRQESTENKIDDIGEIVMCAIVFIGVLIFLVISAPYKDTIAYMTPYYKKLTTEQNKEQEYEKWHKEMEEFIDSIDNRELRKRTNTNTLHYIDWLDAKDIIYANKS